MVFEFQSPEVILGCDPARGGPNGDDCALAEIRGRAVYSVEVAPPADEMGIAAFLATEARRRFASVVAVEVGGLGHSVYVRTRELLARSPIAVLSFLGQEKARYDSRAANRKAETALRLRTALLDGTIGLPATDALGFDRLARELMSLRMATTADGRIRITDPATKSPDFADAVLAGVSYLFEPPLFSIDCDWA